MCYMFYLPQLFLKNSKENWWKSAGSPEREKNCDEISVLIDSYRPQIFNEWLIKRQFSLCETNILLKFRIVSVQGADFPAISTLSTCLTKLILLKDPHPASKLVGIWLMYWFHRDWTSVYQISVLVFIFSILILPFFSLSSIFVFFHLINYPFIWWIYLQIPIQIQIYNFHIFYYIIA